MIGIVSLITLIVLIAVSIETLRWARRPEARRLRMIKKIGRRR